MGKLTVSYKDFDGDIGTVSIPTYTPDLTDLASSGQWQIRMDNLESAMDSITLGNVATVTYSSTHAVANVGNAPSSASQVHYRAVVEYEDSVTGKLWRDISIPTVNIGNDTMWRKSDSETVAILTAPIWTNFVNAFEALMRSPDGNAVTVSKITLKGS